MWGLQEKGDTFKTVYKQITERQSSLNEKPFRGLEAVEKTMFICMHK